MDSGKMDFHRAKQTDPALRARGITEKYDKFTGFFDKFLKNNVQINNCNQKGYQLNLSVSH